MKTLSPVFRAKASGDMNQPIELYDLFLDTTTLHFVNYDKNVTFFGVDNITPTSYIALPITRQTIERSVENPINSAVIAIPNVNLAMSAYLSAHEFRGRRIVIRKIFADELSSSGDVAVMFDGIMDTPAASEETVQVNVTDKIGTLTRQAPRRWYQLLCNNKFMDDQCSYARSSGEMYRTTNYICFSGSTASSLSLGSSPSGDDFWKDGEIYMTSGSNSNLKRKVVNSSGDAQSITLDIALPYVPMSGDTFTVRRGCDKVQATCLARFNNELNFAGFPWIPEEMVIRVLPLLVSLAGLIGGFINGRV